MSMRGKNGQTPAPKQDRGANSSGILILSLTSSCACQCAFCGLPAARPRTLLSKTHLLTALEGHSGSERWSEVNLTGGDPLVIPAAQPLLHEVLERRRSYQRLSISTAGIPASPAIRNLTLLAQSAAELSVFVSLDGVGRVHDTVRGRRGAFDEVSTFLDAARRLPVELALTCVISRLNVDHLDTLADWAAAAEFPVSYALVNLSDHYINSQATYADVSLTPRQIPRVREFLIRRSSQRLDADLMRVLGGEDRRLPCRLLRHGFLVTSDGTVSICGTSQQMILGSLAGGDPAGSWKNCVVRRTQLLTAGAARECRSCTTNCYAWRTGDEAA